MKLNAIVSALLHYVLFVTVYCQTKESEVRLLFRILASQHLLRDDMYGLVTGGDAVCPARMGMWVKSPVDLTNYSFHIYLIHIFIMQRCIWHFASLEKPYTLREICPLNPTLWTR